MSICKKNEKCAKADCTFVHHATKCILWDRCLVAGCGSRHAICADVLRVGFCPRLPACGLNHPPQCLSNNRCTNEGCTFLHSSAKCAKWGTCSAAACGLRHGSSRGTDQPKSHAANHGVPHHGGNQEGTPRFPTGGPVPPKPATACPKDLKCWAANCAKTHSAPKCTSWDICSSLECRTRLRHAKQEPCVDAAALGYCPKITTCCKLHPHPCNAPHNCWRSDCTYLHAVAKCAAWSNCTTAGCDKRFRHAKREPCQDAVDLGFCLALPNCAKWHASKVCTNLTKCWHKECPLLHSVGACKAWDCCTTVGCELRHAKKEWCQAAGDLAFCPALPNCAKLHKPPCEMNAKCWHLDCKLLHSVARCAEWSHCTADGCTLRHTKREWCTAAASLGFCPELPNCGKTHKPLCEKGAKCWFVGCKLLHSVARCGSWDACAAVGCTLRHAKPKVAVEPCAEAAELAYCPNFSSCKKWHPSVCINNKICWTANCPRLHRVAKCANWSNCTDAECKTRLRHGKSAVPAKPAGVKRQYSSPRVALLRQHNAAAAAADDVSVDSETTSYFSVASSRSSISTASLPSAVAVLGLTPIKVPQASKRCTDFNQCKVFECKQAHGKYRRGPCNYGEQCTAVHCKFLHPANWWAADRKLACPQGASCLEEECTTLRHPQERDSRLRLAQEQRQLAERDGELPVPAVPTLINRASGKAIGDAKPASLKQVLPPPPMKTRSREQREKDRQKAGFTILSCRETFVQRLLAERVVIITAETGSGKTTQLPQYCAEALEDGRLVGSTTDASTGTSVNMTYCTQPRKFAARSIAKRVGEEFDGTAQGPSVGYTVGGGAENKRGSRIVFCTDAMLVRQAQNDTQLRDISCLIIDEAHERCLYTDIVLGIAKNLLSQRSNFYVVVASATIEPAVFLNFFFGNLSPMPGPLRVPGRVYDIDLVYKPADATIRVCDLITAHVVPQTKQALRDYPAGHMLVFLQGQKEIEKALRAFNALNLKNVLALPLYSGLEDTDQDKVMNFDQKFPAQRMVVFCTNVAETSITVPGVKIVIDTGLAKASRFDSQRGLQIVEEIFICRSSADQRKGRAGRTSPGTCIRLYRPADLERDNIEPEILHSSLELVALRLLCFNQDPREFPYIAEVEDLSPDRAFRYNVEAACSKLEELGCCTLSSVDSDSTETGGLSQQRRARAKVTEKGKLFSDMQFDPRYCAFILEAGALYDKAEIAIIVAAILMGQGSIFSAEGKKVDRDKRDLQRSEVMKGALVHRSDLLYKLQMYLGWANACNVTSCPKCKAATAGALSAVESKEEPSCSERRSRCFRCSRENATQFGLDEQSLKSVEKTVLEVRAILTKSKGTIDRIATTTSTAGDAVNKSADDLEVIGRCLARFFYDHLVEMIAPTHPEAGVRLVRSCQRGKIDGLSCTLQRVTDLHTAPTHMISMDSKQTSRGDIFVNDMHPIDPAWLPHADVIARCSRYEAIITDFSFQEVAVLPNVGLKLFEAMELKFYDDTDNADLDWKEWVHLTHDVFGAKMQLFAPEQYAMEAGDLIERIHQDVSHELLNTSEALEMVCDGKLLAHVTSGAKVNAISHSESQMEVKKLPSDLVFDDASLREFLCQLCPSVGSPEVLRFCRFSKASVCFPFQNTGKCPRDNCFHSHDAANAAQGTLMLKDETVKAQLQKALGITEESAEQDASKRRAAVDGTVLSFKLSGRLTETQLTAALDQIFIRDGYASRVEACESTPPVFDLVISSLPMEFPEAHIRALLVQSNGVQTKYELVVAKSGRSKTAYAHFNSEEDRDAQCFAVQCAVQSQNIPAWKYIKIFPSDGNRKCKVTLSDLDGADHLCQNALADLQRLGISDSLEAKGMVYVQLCKKYRILEIIADIRNRCDNKITVTEVHAANRNDEKYVFSGTPSLVAKAANLFKAATKPLHYKARTRRESVFVSELFSDGRLASLAQKHDLALAEKGHVERLGEDNDDAAPGKSKRKAVSHIGGFDLHGDIGRQGLFMGEMASYFNDFSARYYSVPLASNTAFLFKNKRIGQVKLSEIPSKVSQIELVAAESYIEVVSYPLWIKNKEKRDTGAVQSTPAQLEKAASDEAYAAVQAVWEIIAELNTAGGSTAPQSPDEICSYCKSTPTNPIRFSVCGHLCCQSCFEMAANQFAERQSTAKHLCCPVDSCATCIAFDDVSKYTNEITKTAVLIKGIQLFSTDNPDRSQVAVCPSENCQTILPKHMPYKACKNCSARVCLQCGCTDDRVHDAVSADMHGRALNPTICTLASNIRGVTDSVVPGVYKSWLQQLQCYGAHSAKLCKKLIAEMPACNLHMCPAGHVMSGARSSMQAATCGLIDIMRGSTCTAVVRKCPNSSCGQMVTDHGAKYLTCGACQTGFCVGCKLVDNYCHAELSGSQNFHEQQVCSIVAATMGTDASSKQLDTAMLQTLRDCNHTSVLHAIQEKDASIASCPVRSCSGIKRKTDLYCRCVKCNFFSCAACGLVDKEEHNKRSCKMAAAEIRRKENEREQQLRAEAERKRLEEEERARILAEKKLKEEQAALAAKEAQRKAEEERKRKEALQRQMKDLTHIFGDSTDIFAECERWARDQWQAGSARICAVYRNEGIAHGCSSAKKFLKGAERVNLKSRSSYRFAWHGTSEQAISPICEFGFDPSKRSGQAYGRGEYFGLNNKISEGYCRGGPFMIVAVLLERMYSTHDICYVVDNPTHWESSYCLPLLVINFSTHKPSPLKSYPQHVQIHSDGSHSDGDCQQDLYEPGAYRSIPFRWYWRTDNGSMERYFDPANVQVERHFDEYAMRGGNSRPIVNIVRYLDDVPQNYCIDFERNEQCNTTTGFKRTIMRKADSIPPGGSWQFLNDSARWQRHDSEMADHMNAHFQAYQSGAASSLMVVDAASSSGSTPCKCPKRAHKFGMFSYDVDFCVGTQRNRSTGTRRQIKKA